MGCWRLYAGCRMLDAGCRMLDAGYWLLVAGCWTHDGASVSLVPRLRCGIMMERPAYDVELLPNYARSTLRWVKTAEP